MQRAYQSLEEPRIKVRVKFDPLHFRLEPHVGIYGRRCRSGTRITVPRQKLFPAFIGRISGDLQRAKG